MFLLQLWKLKKTILINFFSMICTRNCVKNNVTKLSTTSYVISKWRQNVIKMASKELPSISLKLREKCPNTELFLIRIFPHSNWIRRDTLYFPAFGLNRERYFVSLRIQSECGKIQTRNNSVFGHFSRSVSCAQLRLKWRAVCQVVRFISPLSLKLQIKFWIYFHNTFSCSAGNDCNKKVGL